MFHKRTYANRLFIGFLTLTLLAGSAAFPTRVLAATLMVTNTSDSGPGSLRQAIADAAPGDTITFDPALSGQTIHLASTLILAQDVTIDGSGLSSKITISGDSDNNGTGDVRVFYIENVFGIAVTLDSLIVTKGWASGAGDDGEGGAILNRRAVTIRNSIFLNNSSSGSGGAISAHHLVTIIDSTFSGNSSTASVGGGGVIYNVYLVTIAGSTFIGNSADIVAGGVGGAILNTAQATITNSTFVNNTASLGGAILTTNDLTITNSTIAGNTASYLTGGLDIEGHTTNLSNTIIANNFVTASGKNEDCLLQEATANFGTNTNNLIEDGTCSAALSGDPKLGPLADNGGATQTMALLSGSPAIDAGDDAICPATDQRGVTRPRGSHCDLGAHEAVIHHVKASASGANSGASWIDAYTDLQFALTAAHSGDQIWVAAGTYAPTPGTDRTISFTLKNDVTVYGGFAGTETLLTQRNPAANSTILSGEIGVAGNHIDNSYHVLSGGGTNNTAVLDGFMITAGNANGIPPFDLGGGMYNDNSDPTLTNLTFANNLANVGGGIYNLSSDPSLTDVTFISNAASLNGGGMANNSSHPTLTNVTFSNNSAASYGGGAAQSFSSPTLVNVTFSGNSAGISGGAIANDVSSPTIINSILYGDLGGEIHNFGISSSPVVTTSIVQGGYPGTGNLNANPLLGPLQDNGGFTQTMALLSGSPAINTGDDANCPSRDQRGVTRPQNSHCDIGAYEYQKKKNGNDTAGVFRPSNGLLYLKNQNSSGFADVTINYGLAGDTPVIGDWDGDGTVTIGIYRNGSFYLRNENTVGFADLVFAFGVPGDQPIAGDWNGDGIDSIGVYRSSTGTFFLRNTNSTGTPDMIFALGVPGDVGIAGDWNNDGFDTTGVFRPGNGALYLKNTNVTGFADIQLNYGLPGDKPVTGDWDNNGTDTIGVYRNGTFYLRNSNTIGFADLVFDLGIPGDLPIAGNWDGMP